MPSLPRPTRDPSRCHAGPACRRPSPANRVPAVVSGPTVSVPHPAQSGPERSTPAQRPSLTSSAAARSACMGHSHASRPAGPTPTLSAPSAPRARSESASSGPLVCVPFSQCRVFRSAVVPLTPGPPSSAPPPSRRTTAAPDPRREFRRLSNPGHACPGHPAALQIEARASPPPPIRSRHP